jgi:hypothetical protein
VTSFSASVHTVSFRSESRQKNLGQNDGSSGNCPSLCQLTIILYMDIPASLLFRPKAGLGSIRGLII